MRGVYTIIYKDLKRLIKHRGALLTLFLFPIIVVFVIMFSVSSFSFQTAQILIGSTIIVFAFLPALSSAIVLSSELEHGLLKDLFAAPIPRMEIVLGKILSSISIILLPPVLLLLISAGVGYLEVKSWLFAIVGLILTAFYLSGFSFALAIKLKRVQSFQFVGSFIGMVLLFLSNAILPLAALPIPIKTIAMLNPTTYTIDLFRFSIDLNNEIDPLISLSVLMAMAVIAFFISVLMLKKEVS